MSVRRDLTTEAQFSSSPHPRRSAARSEQSVKGLQALHKAIVQGDADAAEKLARDEVMHAAEEIVRILGR